MARSFAGLFGMGGVVCAITLVLQHPHDRVLAGLIAPAVAALMLALVLLVWGSRFPMRVFFVLPPVGSLLIAAVSYSGGSGMRDAYAVFFFWAIAAAFYFFPRRVAFPNVPIAMVLYAIVLWLGNEPFGAIRYFLPMAAVIVTALLIDRLNLERERLQREMRNMIQGLDELARTDPLTGLANRREFEDTLSRELARAERGSSAISVLMIDLDHFKIYNDTHGHVTGDAMLRATAKSWKERLRIGDLLARYGGEEFAAILPACDEEDAIQLAERLRESVPEHETCSIGVASWDRSESSRRLIRRADNALLQAKRNGRDQVQLASAYSRASASAAARSPERMAPSM